MSEISSATKRASLFQMMSLISLILVPLIVLRTLESPSNLVTQPQSIGLIFIVICILGVIVGIRPSSFSRSVSSQSIQEDRDESQATRGLEGEPAIRGHHYTCDSFSDHVLRVGTNVYCAGCTGLVTGAMIAIFGSIVYVFLGVEFLGEGIIFWAGFAGVFLGIVQHQFYRLLSIRSGLFRFSLNAIFVVSAFFLLVGANRIVGDLTVDLYIICVILLWILTRIMMSKGQHEQICMQCNVETCNHPLY